MATNSMHFAHSCTFFLLFRFILGDSGDLNSTKAVINIGDTIVDLIFLPPEIERLIQGLESDVYIKSYLHNLENPPSGEEGNFISLKVVSGDPHIATVSSEVLTIPLDPSKDAQNQTFTVKGEFLGRTHLKFYAKSGKGKVMNYHPGGQGGSEKVLDPWAPPPRPNITGAVSTQRYVDIPAATDDEHLVDDWQRLDVKYKVSVIREERMLDHIFLMTVSVVHHNIIKGFD